MLFITTASLIKWGFDNHRTVRRKLQDPEAFGNPVITNVCINWALRNLTGNGSDGKCDSGGPPKCVTRAMDVSLAAGYSFEQQMYHSFWMLEEWCLRLYNRTPPASRNDALEKSMLVLGFSDTIIHSPRSIGGVLGPPPKDDFRQKSQGLALQRASLSVGGANATATSRLVGGHSASGRDSAVVSRR